MLSLPRLNSNILGHAPKIAHSQLAASKHTSIVTHQLDAYATAPASATTVLEFKFVREALFTQWSRKENWWQGKEYLPNLLEITLLPKYFVFEVRNIRSSPWTPFWPRVLTQIGPGQCKWVIVTDLWQLYYYYKSQKVVIIFLPFTTSKDTTNQLLCPNSCAGQFWVQIQNPCWKQSLSWKFEIPNFKTKNRGNNVVSRRLGKYTFYTIVRGLIWLYFSFFHKNLAVSVQERVIMGCIMNNKKASK